MNTLNRLTTRAVVLCGISVLLPLSSQAWEPNAKDRDAAIAGGDFAGYFTNLSTWLGQKVPADPGKISAAALTGLLEDQAFVNALDQRQFIAKLGADELGTFAKSDPGNRELLEWILNDTGLMDPFLQSAGPTPIQARDDNAYSVSPKTLDIWRKILKADPEAKYGIHRKLAMATAIAPPRGIGAGSADTLADPVDRYLYVKNAHKNKELVPSFDHLTVWEYTKVVSSGASDSDLTWAREMINTWRPDLKHKEQVIESTREVWRRAAPAQFYPGGYGNFRNVLAGGGKCGPRSSWAVMICQAFGIPAIGVGQPAHACAAAKSAYPEVQPQPGSAWKVHQGGGWQVSKLDGTTGLLFLEAVAERAHPAEFAQIEHLRWLASTLAAPEQAAAVRAVAAKIREALTPTTPTPAPEATPKPEGVTGSAASAALPPPAVAEEPFKAVPGTIHIEAETFSNSFIEAAFPNEQKSCVYVLDCSTGGKQLNFQRNMKTCWVEYTVDVPESGTYGLVARVAVVNVDQILDVSLGESKLATIEIPITWGVWTTTEPVEVKLSKGSQTLRISAPMQRGVAIRWFELKAK